jgi:hypothetical protein
MWDMWVQSGSQAGKEHWGMPMREGGQVGKGTGVPTHKGGQAGKGHLHSLIGQDILLIRQGLSTLGGINGSQCVLTVTEQTASITEPDLVPQL